MNTKSIPNFSNYTISDDGEVRNITRDRVVSQANHPRGYKMVGLYGDDGKRVHLYVHRLVGQAFVPNPACKPQINHKDGDKSNNNASNLEWTTCQENTHHAIAIGLRDSKGEASGMAKLNDEVVKMILMTDCTQTHEQIANCLGVSRSTITKIKNRQTWTHIHA